MLVPYVPYHARIRAPKKQNGVTLFFAMIGLVVLLLAAAALVRTVDTASLIAGNLSFRMSATSAGDRGMETAMRWLNNRVVTAAAGAPVGSQAAIDAGIAATNSSIPVQGYYSSTNEVANLFQANTWTPGGAALNLGEDNGNTVRYVVERMCRRANTAPTEQDCIYTEVDSGGSQLSGGNPRTPSPPKNALIFRITVRVEGPRNTVSYIQGFVY